MAIKDTSEVQVTPSFLLNQFQEVATHEADQCSTREVQRRAIRFPFDFDVKRRSPKFLVQCSATGALVLSAEGIAPRLSRVAGALRVNVI